MFQKLIMWLLKLFLPAEARKAVEDAINDTPQQKASDTYWQMPGPGVEEDPPTIPSKPIEIKEWELDWEDHLIPLAKGQAVSRGWTSVTDKKPAGVTLHWTATKDLALCTKILGGANALRKGAASCHWAVGRSFEEGIDQYVTMKNRSWHAGAGQTLDYLGGKRKNSSWSGARTTLGIEIVDIGYARKNLQVGFDGSDPKDWIPVDATNGRQRMMIQPWPDEQMTMLVKLGQHVIETHPHILPEHWHGHHDLCPGYKQDVMGFPFAEYLRAVYEDDSIEDIWTPFHFQKARQQALVDLGYSLGTSGPNGDGVDGDWGRMSDAALRKLQIDTGMVENGEWTTFTCREVFSRLNNGKNVT